MKNKLNKQQMIEAVNNIPEFIFRNTAVNGQWQPDDVIETDKQVWTHTPNWKAITEKDNNEPLIHVTPKYKLIQFKDEFMPILNKFDDCTGRVLYLKGYGRIDVFPTDENTKIGEHRIGIAVINSVNKLSSVVIKFVILHDNLLTTVPKSIAGFKHVHVGTILEKSINYIEVIEKIKTIWASVITDFGKVIIDEPMAISIMDSMKIKDDFIRKVITQKARETANFNLWDLFIQMINTVENKTSYTSELHKVKKLDDISEKVFEYAGMAKIISANK